MTGLNSYLPNNRVLGEHAVKSPAYEALSALSGLLATTNRSGSRVGVAAQAIGVEQAMPAEEEVIVRSAVLGRRREFVAGRNCARRALLLVGGPPLPILKGP